MPPSRKAISCEGRVHHQDISIAALGEFDRLAGSCEVISRSTIMHCFKPGLK
ncbi:MAG: hypothetical protein MZV70_30760 [Desulfobacterales bacterium]|nr:hypothetical protein [Desulfobacterales bacterium]